VRYTAGVCLGIRFRQREAEYDAARAQLPPVEAPAANRTGTRHPAGPRARALMSDKIDRSSQLSAPALPTGMPRN